jgi:5-methylcytosine-specific restriction endonuclease McrA
MSKFIQKECKKHGITKFRVHRTGSPRCLKCSSEFVSKRRKKVKDILIQEAGGKCLICGYKKYRGALSFHHIKPEEKKFNIAKGGNTIAIDKLRKEVKKCALLCMNCHAEIEGNVIKLNCREAELVAGT